MSRRMPAPAADPLQEPRWTALAGALLEREVAATRDETVGAAADSAIADAEDQLAAVLDADGALSAIVASAELTDPETRVLAVCSAIELDRGLQRLVGLLLHDPSATRPDVDLLARLLGPGAVAALADDARLLRAALLEVEPQVAFAAARVAVPRRVIWSLLDDPSLDPGLPLGAELSLVDPSMAGGHDLVAVSGEDRIRRLQAAQQATAGIGFLITPAPDDEHGWQVLVRQATVAGLGVVLELAEPPTALQRRWIDRADHLRFALCSRHPLPVAALPDRELQEVAAAPAAATDAEWSAVFPGAGPPARRPTAEQLQLARGIADGLGDPSVAIRRVADGTSLQHAERIVPAIGWNDLILPPDRQQQLQSLSDRYRQRSRVHDDWGLPLYPSPGVVAMFSGPSGTGKTTAAEVIAADLGVQMYRVDLSTLVSKYVGETEKNLEAIFTAAHAGDYLLLFDEADALFGSRSKVSDARDRYANMEVSYLLQRLESFDGFVVLTSNFQGNIDPAFLRRMHAIVHFEVPGPADRLRIWERCLAGAPRDDVDLTFVAEKFDLSGGSIRMTALAAAFQAASAGTPVGMVEILRAAAAEMAKLRRRASDDQFGRWLPDVKRLPLPSQAS